MSTANAHLLETGGCEFLFDLTWSLVLTCAHFKPSPEMVGSGPEVMEGTDLISASSSSGDLGCGLTWVRLTSYLPMALTEFLRLKLMALVGTPLVKSTALVRLNAIDILNDFFARVNTAPHVPANVMRVIKKTGIITFVRDELSLSTVSDTS